jgi:hypothetical protein
VLERDVILSEIYDMALKAGFEEVFITLLMQPQVINYKYADWMRL